MTEPAIPAAVSEATFTLFGVRLRCYVLEDGERIIHADDVIAFFDALANGDGSEPSIDELGNLSRWLKGVA